MLTIDEVKKRLKPYVDERQLMSLSVQLKVRYELLWRVATGRLDNPTYNTIKPIVDFLEKQ